MLDRKQITLLYQFNPNWIGGAYYILNIIRALKTLDDAEKPFLTIMHDDSSSIQPIEEINYPYIAYQSFNANFTIVQRLLNRSARLTIGYPLFYKKLPAKKIENLYPVTDLIDTSNVNKYYYWVADLQESYLPELFSKREVIARTNILKTLRRKQVPIVFSSESAKNDFDTFYAGNKNQKEVLQFISTMSTEYEKEINQVLEKFEIKQSYFIVCNQFWQHKNHRVVIDALKQLLADKELNFQVVFTGKEHDYRNPNHTIELKKYIADNGLNNYIKFLGFIDRNDQLALMKNAMAIIQPSLFEGWSTVVEDAKFLNKLILCSDIPVHREQLPDSEMFFNPHDPEALSNLMKKVAREEVALVTTYNHDKAIQTFARKFIKMF